jgi:hypothetical protein
VLVRELSKGVSVCVKGWLSTPSHG